MNQFLAAEASPTGEIGVAISANEQILVFASLCNVMIFQSKQILLLNIIPGVLLVGS